MSLAVVSTISDTDARDLDRRVDKALGNVFELLAEVFRTGAWLTLGHASWADYLATKGDLATVRIPAAERPEVYGRLREAGMSNVQIAEVAGVSDKTVASALPRSTSSENSEVNDLGPHQVLDAELISDTPDDALTEEECETLDAERPDDILTEEEWQAAGDDEPDYTEPEDFAPFVASVQKAFYTFALAEKRFSVDRIAEVARADPQFAATLREDITRARRWFKQLDAAIRP